ncbi:MAG: acetate--CoA ligase family protein [Candidatus Methanoperedens sp.]|nr:acetate--CoA ligase family protein [Candidatus Methanoperedens sp.]
MEKKLLSEAEGYELLKKYGIPTPENTIVKSADEAVKTADKMGYPVVAKIISPQVVHKSDVGGVVTGIRNNEEVRRAYDKILKNVREKVPEAEITGIIIEKDMPHGLELIVGGRIDPSFGKVITFGLGGTLVEFLKDVSIKVLPIRTDEIEKMIREIKGYALIKGYRGEPPKDEKELVQVINNVSRLFCESDKLVEFDINPLILYEKGACAVDARIYETEGEVKHEEKPQTGVPTEVFYPGSIAVIGASSNPNKVGYAVFRNLLDFPGKLYAVNPKREEILRHKVYPDLISIPDTVDMIVVTVPAAVVPEIMEEAGKKGVKLAVIITAGFKEIGKEGAALQDKVSGIAQKYGIRIIGPNCLGLILPHKGINATFDPANPKPGDLAFISQSGAIITTVVDWSLKEDVEIGLSAVISVGNQADLGFNEFMKFARDDKDTRAIVLYIEEIKNGRLFMKVAGEVSEKKPIVAIKSGSSKRGQKAASSHTGALAGSYNVYMAAFKQSGVIATHSLREAFQVGELLASEEYPKGNRAVVITNAGGFAVLSTDYAEKYGVELVDLPKDLMDELNSFLTPEWSHENPMDIVGDAGADRYARVFDVMVRNQDKWDITFVIAVPSSVLDSRQLAQEIVRFSNHTHKMIVGCLLGGNSMKSGVHILRKNTIPNFAELEEAFDVVGKALSIRGEQRVQA